jgi:WD40 repeat protein
MTLLFVSHSSEDDASASRVADWLAERGFQSLFLDFDPVRGIPAGRNWEQELYARLRQADAVVFLGSAASLQSHWCFAELALARAWGVRVFPLLVQGEARHPLLGDLQWVDLTRDGDAALEGLLAGLRLHGLDPATTFAWDPARPPYPGLRAFQHDDAAVFFGRDKEVDELLKRLQTSLRRSASLTLVGPSGSGKSSLVHAGLLPRLRRLPGEWALLPPVFPGDRPVAALARSLALGLAQERAPRDWRELEERLRRDPGELLEFARDLAQAQGTDARLVLLVIDQAEEFVTLAGDEAREDFLRVIGAAVNATAPLRILLTLRSEFLSGLLQRPGMSELLRDWMALGPLDRARLPAVIAGPARRAGLTFEDGLVEQIVEDAQGGDALPLLAYTLRQLHERAGVERRISRASYEDRGGVVGALRGQADQLLEDLDRRGLGAVVLPTLLKLATLGDGDEPTRRRFPRNHLGVAENQVIDAFIDAHLLVSDLINDEPVVAVAHEALLRSWSPLAEAIAAARDDLRQRAQLERLSLDWEHADRQPAYALAGARLQAAQRWAEAHPDEMEQLPLLREFLQASAESDASARRRIADSLAQRVLDGFDDDPDLAVPLAVAAIEEHGPSDRLVEALREALRRSRVRAVLTGHGAPVTSVAWARDGLRAATGAADGAVRLWNTMNGHQLLAIDGDGEPVTGLAFSPDGSEVAIATNDRAGRVLELTGQRERLSIRGNRYPFIPRNLMYMPDGDRIVGVCGGDVVIWDAGDGGVLEVLGGIGSAVAPSPDGDRIFAMDVSANSPSVRHIGGGGELLNLKKTGGYYTHHARENVYASSVAWSPDGQRLAAALEDGAWVWDAHAGGLLAKLLPGQPVAAPVGASTPITSVAFSADGSHVVSLFRDGVPRVWDASDGRELLVLRGHGAAVTCTAFAPRGTRVLTGSDDGTARVWEVGDGHDVAPGVDGLLYHLRGYAVPLTSAVFSPDGTRLVTASTDGTVRLWEAGTGGAREIAALHGHSDVVSAAAFSPDGSLILTVSEDGTLRFWPAEGGEPRIVQGPGGVGHAAGKPAQFTSAAFSQDGSRVVAGLGDSTARVWDAASSEQRLGLAGHYGRVTSVAFSPDGSRIATGSWDHIFSSSMVGEATACIWDATTGQQLRRLTHFARVLSVAFSPDGAWVATGTEDAAARVWDAETGEELWAVREHGAGVRSVAFSPDNTRLLTASDDATARVWDIVDGRERFVFAGHAGPVRSASFAPDGGRIVTASDDATARVWQETGVEELLRTAHRRLPRRLTPDERRRFGLPERAAKSTLVTRVADLPEAEDDDGGQPAERDVLIAERALAIARSSKAGSDEENWIRAEDELRAEGKLAIDARSPRSL